MGWLSDLWKYGFTPTQRARSLDAERYAQALAAYEEELAALSAPDAHMAAERVLAKPRFIRVVRWGALPTRRPEFAPALRAFFERIQRVEVPRGEQRADVAEIEPLEWAPGYLRLGTDSEHTHLAIRPGDEAIYVLADDVPSADRVESVFATIYHWVLWLERNEELLADSEPPAA
jgi:hypothetical protein